MSSFYVFKRNVQVFNRKSFDHCVIAILTSYKFNRCCIELVLNSSISYDITERIVLLGLLGLVDSANLYASEAVFLRYIAS